MSSVSITLFVDETTDITFSPSQMESASAQMASTTSSAPKTRQTRSNLDLVQKSQNSPAGSQNVYSLTNKETGDTREGTSDSMLVEIVKKLNEAENLVNSLRQQLRSKKEEDNFSSIEQSVESDLECKICYEMYIKPTVLNCSHTFCHDCIESWTRSVNSCPICRVNVKSKVYCLPLDNYLDKITERLPEDIKSRRESLKVERNNAVETNRARKNTRRRNRNQLMRRSLGVPWNEHIYDNAEWNNAFEEALYQIRLDIPGRIINDGGEWEDAFDQH